MKLITKSVTALFAAAAISSGLSFAAMAEEDILRGPALSSGTYIVTIEAESLNVNRYEDSDEVLATVHKDDVYQLIEDMGNGWAKISIGGTEGYIPLGEGTEITETASVEDAVASTTETEAANRRQAIVDYALSFVGAGRYVYGGSNPHTGTDCSGFMKYVLENSAGIGMLRSSSAQATQGVAVNPSQMKPGDLIFYGNGGSINHVAMYIGNGEVVHASTASVGIIVSPWNYRNAVKAVNVIGA